MTATVALGQDESMTRTERAAESLLRARVSVLLMVLTVLGAAVALIRSWTEPGIVAAAAGLVAVLLVLARVALSDYLLHQEQKRTLRDLREVRRIAEEDLRTDQRQNAKLEQLLGAMRDFNVIQGQALEELRQAKPATRYYLESHTDAISDVLTGAWNRRESLRPEQLWREYGDLLGMLREGQLFRSTVVVPDDPESLLANADFNRYVDKIYDAAERIEIRRLIVLDRRSWPPRRDDLPGPVLEHLTRLREVEGKTAGLTARVTTRARALMAFNEYPDFMIWGDDLLIESNLDGPEGLVVKAVFYFAGTQDEQIRDRQRDFENLFGNAEQAVTLDGLLGKRASRGPRTSRRRRRTTR